MDDKNQLIYFIKTQKENLGFENNKELLYKIKNSFDFRFKLQKYVFISKYFGWNHHYNYKLYVKGPYSTALAEDYYSKDFLNYTPIKINDFNLNSFNKFVEKKDSYNLEATSTILFEKISSIDNAINKIKQIKPHIPTNIIEKSFYDIKKFNLTQNIYLNDTILESLNETKNLLKNKINFYINYFEDFGECNNGIIVAGNLEYLKLTLNKENLNNDLKDDLLRFLSIYMQYIEKIYYYCDGDGEKFSEINLNKLEKFFNVLQDYISKDLNIIPRMDEDSFEKYFYY